ncbi:MAG: dolichol kinase [Ignavibacteria bacterium]|nr:dolichol kinase [Ignavibacteria bacterium]
MSNQITYAGEIARKGIHLASVGIPLVYLNVTHLIAMEMLFALTAFSVVLDLVKHFHKPTRRWFLKAFGKLLRSHEVQTDKLLLTGASWVLIAAFLTFLIFPPVVGVTAFTILILSDTFAALIGRRVQSRRFLDKSLAGFITFVIASWLVVGFYGYLYDLPSEYLLAGCVSGFIGGVVESASIRLRLDDNLSVPFSVAVFMMIFNAVFALAGMETFTHLIP